MNHRFNKLYAELTAQERAAMHYYAGIEEETPAPEITNTMPRSQASQFRWHMTAIDALYRYIGVRLCFQFQRSEAIMLRFLLWTVTNSSCSDDGIEPTEDEGTGEFEDNLILNRTKVELPDAWDELMCFQILHNDLLAELGVQDHPIRQITTLLTDTRNNLQQTINLMATGYSASIDIDDVPEEHSFSTWKRLLGQFRSSLK